MIAERQLGSGQDYAVCGTVGNTRYVGVLDGHGNSRCIDFARSLDFNEVAAAPDPAIYLHGAVKSIGDTYRSGFTFTFARVTTRSETEFVEVWNVGDSETRVYLDGKAVYQTTEHNFLNESEIGRTAHLCTVKAVDAPFPVSEDRIENKLSPVGQFYTGEDLVPSMAFGHNDMTGMAASYWAMKFSGSLRVVCGSDGFFDMLVPTETGSADELADEAARRWQKNWVYFDGKKTQLANFAGAYDDVAVAVLV